MMKRVSKVFNALSAAAFIVSIMALLSNVVSRAMLGQSIKGVFEVSTFATIILASTAAVVAQRDNAHIEMSVVLERMRENIRRLVRSFASTVAALALLLVSYSNVKATIVSYEVNQVFAVSWPWPLWPLRALLSISLIVLGLMTLVGASRPLANRRRDVAQRRVGMGL